MSHTGEHHTDQTPQREVTSVEMTKGSRTFHFYFALGLTCCWTNILLLFSGASQSAFHHHFDLTADTKSADAQWDFSTALKRMSGFTRLFATENGS